MEAYELHHSWKVLLYSNSKTNAETTLTKGAEDVLDGQNIIGDVIALTGDCGIMMETFMMAAFLEFGINQTVLQLRFQVAPILTDVLSFGPWAVDWYN